ncbi:TolC family protein [Spirosoma pulveris]
MAVTLLFKSNVLKVSRYRKYWIGLWCYWLSYTASAQKNWTLADCLAFAQTNNIQLQQANLIQDKQVLAFQRARNQALPTLDARVRSAGNWGFLIDPSTNVLSNQFNLGNQASLTLNLDLFNGFANANRLKLSRQEISTANYAYQIRRNAISLEVMDSFLEVLVAGEQLRNAKQRSAYLAKQHQKVKAQVSKGVLSKRDILTLQSLIATEDLTGVYAEVSLEKARFNLMKVMGLPLTEAISVDTIRLPDYWLPAERTLDEVMDASLTSLPELKAAESMVQSTDHAWQIERASFKPVLAFTAQLATRTSNYKPEGFSSQLRDNLNQQVGFSFYMPIFNRFLMKNTDQRAKLDIRFSQLAYQQVDRDLRDNVMQAFLACKGAARKLKALQIQYDAISEEYRYAVKMLELGGIDAVGYSETRSRLIAAQSELLQTKYDSFFKDKVLDFYQGKPLSF